MPFVSEDAAGWKYHLVVREQLFRGLFKLAPQRFASLHESLANYYDHSRNEIEEDFIKGLENEYWRHLSLEYLYHRLCQQPQIHQPIALNESLIVFREKWRELENWAALIMAAGKDLANRELTKLSQTLVNTHAYFANNEFDQFVHTTSS
jgi:hypothetical protein